MAEDEDDLESAEPEAPFIEEPPPPGIAALVRTCVDYVRRAVGVELDFTPETLPILDHYLRQARSGAAERDEVAPIVAQAAGAYFGELVRQQIGGFWRLPSEDAFEWEVCARGCFLSLRVLGPVYDALYPGAEHQGPPSALRLLPGEREVVERRLEQLPKVSEDEFHMLATRLEVIEIAHEALRANRRESGDEEVFFNDRDYAAETD